MVLPPRLRRYTSLNVALDMLVNDRITLAGYAPWIDVNDRRGMALYQEALHYKFVGAACLSMAKETFHHWSVFAGGSSGVCIHFDVRVLLSLFQDSPYFLTGPVQYQLLDDMRAIDASDIHALPFLKRKGFVAEEEFRIVGVSVEQTEAIHIPLPRTAITRLTLSPFLHPSLVTSTVNVIHKIEGWDQLPVVHSRLTDSHTWERRLASFVRRHGVIYGDWIDTPMNLPEED